VKQKRFSVEQITSVLLQVGGGVPVGDVCRQVGISEQTFYRWKKEYGGMLPSEARELKQVRDGTPSSNGSSRTCPWTRSCSRMSFKKSSKARQAT
jgi:transposase-like protein